MNFSLSYNYKITKYSKYELVWPHQVQYETGFRASEAYAAINDLEKHLDDLKLHSIRGKGGQVYNAKIISLELKLMLLKLKAQNLKIPHQSTYYRHLQKYDMASYDIRAFYTKELYEEKREKGLSHSGSPTFFLFL